MKKASAVEKISRLSVIWSHLLAPFRRLRSFAISARYRKLRAQDFTVPIYQQVRQEEDADRVFSQLQRYFYQRFVAIRESLSGQDFPDIPNLFWESGKIEPGRKYFFIKRPNEIGWLFERSGYGWVVSRSEKIIEKDMFMRRDAPWDIVMPYVSEDKHFRIASQNTNGELISHLLYQQISFEEVVSPELQDWLT